MSRLMIRYGFRWSVAVLTPVLLTMLVWQIGVIPARKKLASVRETNLLIDLKPRLEALVSESDAHLSGKTQDLPGAQDMASLEKWFKEQAQTRGVKIEELNNQQQAGPEASSVKVDIKVAGDFFKLMRWLKALEENPTIRVDHWAMAASSVPGEAHQLDINIQVLEKNL